MAFAKFVGKMLEVLEEENPLQEKNAQKLITRALLGGSLNKLNVNSQITSFTMGTQWN